MAFISLFLEMSLRLKFSSFDEFEILLNLSVCFTSKNLSPHYRSNSKVSSMQPKRINQIAHLTRQIKST